VEGEKRKHDSGGECGGGSSGGAARVKCDNGGSNEYTFKMQSETH